MQGFEGIAELGFAGLAAILLFGVFKWMTGELTKKIDNLQDIIIKLIDAKNEMKNEFKELNDEVLSLKNQITNTQLEFDFDANV